MKKTTIKHASSLWTSFVDHPVDDNKQAASNTEWYSIMNANNVHVLKT